MHLVNTDDLPHCFVRTQRIKRAACGFTLSAFSETRIRSAGSTNAAAVHWRLDAWIEPQLLTVALVRPKETRLTEAIRLLPDTLRLLTRLSKDTSLPRRVRIRAVLLLVYLASPIDLIPDFIPVIGYADDAIISYVVLRSVVRAAGPDVVTNHWPGSPEGLTAIRRLLRTA